MIASMFVAGGAAAQGGVPDLSGKWTSMSGWSIGANGTPRQYPEEYEIKTVIDVTKQTGSVFTATLTLQPKAGTAVGTYYGKEYSGQPTPMRGAIDAEGGAVVIVEVGDGSRLDCSLTGTDTMRCLLSETGVEAFAGFRVYKRGE
ncbi:MAG: hypothetical protein GY798_16285 [Hyphomicrobiales bacterium]|nr:hypothetical protein [Hyphomicrobiales bacterium]